GGENYTRLGFTAGPGAAINIDVGVDWAALPELIRLQGKDLSQLVADWQREYDRNIIRPCDEWPSAMGSVSPAATAAAADNRDNDTNDAFDHLYTDPHEQQIWQEAWNEYLQGDMAYDDLPR